MSERAWWWLSCDAFTVAVEVDGGTLVAGPPIVQKFIPGPAGNLGRWMRKIGGFKCTRI